MGTCGCKPIGCVGMKGKLKVQKKRDNKRRTRRAKRAHSANTRNRVEPSNQNDLSYKVSQAGSPCNVVTPRFANNLIHGSDSQLNSADPQDEGENPTRNEMGEGHSCGFISNAFLSCLACDESSDEKRKSPIPGGPSPRKKSPFTPSFKWRGHENPILSKTIIQRPVAGSQVMRSPLEKKLSESWLQIEPNTFKFRWRSCTRDKKKKIAPNCAAYIPFGVDVFLSHHKINHVARLVEPRGVPPMLVVNLQIPLYPATIFQNEHDGAGTSFVFYFKLSEDYSEDLPVHFQENIKDIANETEKIKGFPMDTNAPCKERLKILGRVVNYEGLQLSTAERKLVQVYNEKPSLSRPQHEFYSGENYVAIDLDIHRFSYIAQKVLKHFATGLSIVPSTLVCQFRETRRNICLSVCYAV